MKRVNVGGQAVIEGVMMQSPNKKSIAIRKNSGEIVVKSESINRWVDKYKLGKIPIVRGAATLIETLLDGMNSLNYSSEIFIDGEEEQDQEESKIDEFLSNIFKDKAKNIIIGISMIIAIVVSVGLFILIPTFTGGAFSKIIKNPILLNLIEGVIRILILFAYLVLISKNEDLKRVFQYHGAEHKSIHCYENGEELTVENARKYKRLHPRCGTNFLFIVMVASIIVLSFFGWPNPLLRVVMRIVMVPVVAGLSYEVIRILGKYHNQFTNSIAYPGMILQYLTTKEPDDKQLEVALRALKSVLED